MLEIIKKTGVHCTTPKHGRQIKWIFIHYTAGTSSQKGAAASTAAWFASRDAKGSADFIVDDGSIVQYNPDIRNRYCWAVGGVKYRKMVTSLGGKYYAQAWNNNSISVEICSCKKNTKSLKDTDTDWYFTDAAVRNTVDLVRYLMQEYHIDIDHVIMHHMRTGKICPNPWCVNESRLSGWRAFLALVKGEGAVTSAQEKSDVRIDDKYRGSYRILPKNGLNLRAEPGNGRILTAMPRGAKVTNYSRYKVVGGKVWLWVAYSGIQGYCLLDYLDKA